MNGAARQPASHCISAGNAWRLSFISDRQSPEELMLESQAPTISRTMTITHAEFRRTLANAVVGWDYRVQGDEIYVSLDSDTGIHIHLSGVPTAHRAHSLPPASRGDHGIRRSHISGGRCIPAALRSILPARRRIASHCRPCEHPLMGNATASKGLRKDAAPSTRVGASRCAPGVEPASTQPTRSEFHLSIWSASIFGLSVNSTPPGIGHTRALGAAEAGR